MSISMINMPRGLGNKLKKIMKMIGTMLKKEFMMIIFSKRKFMKHKKQKIWRFKLSIR